jgi:hypothetical protein
VEVPLQVPHEPPQKLGPHGTLVGDAAAQQNWHVPDWQPCVRPLTVGHVAGPHDLLQMGDMPQVR